MSRRDRGISVVNTDDMGVGIKEEMYHQGGIFSIVLRILFVDLFTKLLNPIMITRNREFERGR